jgi:hypothetical protein
MASLWSCDCADARRDARVSRAARTRCVASCTQRVSYGSTRLGGGRVDEAPVAVWDVADPDAGVLRSGDAEVLPVARSADVDAEDDCI